jgi:hypothetical protein
LAGALAGVRFATRAGLVRWGVGRAALVGIKWVAVLVVLVVLGGTATVVGGTGTVVVVGAGCATCDNGAVGCVALESAAWVCGDEVRSTESMATTAVAVTRGAATTLVAG